jgi:hypothetical protein
MPDFYPQGADPPHGGQDPAAHHAGSGRREAAAFEVPPLEAAFDLKVFFEVMRVEPAEVTTADGSPSLPSSAACRPTTRP